MTPNSAEASRDLSHLNSGTYKGSFTPLLQLKKFPDIPVSTREEARESRPHPEEPRFRLLAREEGSFPCVVGKEFPAFPSHLKRRRKRGSSGCGQDSRASSRVETGMSGNFLSCSKGVKDPLEVPEVRCD